MTWSRSLAASTPPSTSNPTGRGKDLQHGSFFSLASSHFSWGMFSMLEKCRNSPPLSEFQPMAVGRRGEKRGMLNKSKRKGRGKIKRNWKVKDEKHVKGWKIQGKFSVKDKKSVYGMGKIHFGVKRVYGFHTRYPCMIFLGQLYFCRNGEVGIFFIVGFFGVEHHRKVRVNFHTLNLPF